MLIPETVDDDTGCEYLLLTYEVNIRMLEHVAFGW